MNPDVEKESFLYIGESWIRVDGKEKVTGRALYGADTYLPNMLHGKILRSSLPHAKILNIDISKAVRIPGVKAVVTSKDTPKVRYGHFLCDETLFAWDKVRYVGDEIAAVAAVDLETAEEALGVISVDYEELRAVFDPIEAMGQDASIIHEELKTYTAKYDCERYGNISSVARFHNGDMKQGFKESDLIFEDTYRTQVQHQCYIEPHAAVASVDINGNVTVRTTTQIPFRVRSLLCGALQIPMNKLRIITTRIGGGFGGKETRVDAYAVLLAQKTRQPVKIVLTREEEFRAATPRHSSIIRLKSGVKRNGILRALEAEIIFDSGAYADHGGGTVSFAGQCAGGRYVIPNINIVGYLVYTNKTINGAYRGYGNPQITFAHESQIDTIAEQLGLDPLDIRLLNAVKQGDTLVTTGEKFPSVAFKETLEKAAIMADWKTKKRKKFVKRGIGIAGMYHVSGLLGSSAMIKANEDGTMTILMGAVDIGTGTETVVTQIAAEVLGVPPRSISIVSGDTETTPYDFGSVSSRTLYTAGNAVKLAAEDVKQQLFKIAADKLGAKAEDLTAKEGRIYVSGTPEKSLSISEVAFTAVAFKGGPITGRGSYLPDVKPYDPKIVTGCPWGAYPFPNHVHGTQVAEVEVDTETGQVSVLKAIAVHDVGKAINPNGIRGQLIGGIQHGVGYALTESMKWDDKGNQLTFSFLDYKVPRSTDMPKEIQVDWVESNDPLGPFGAKGVGEPGMVPTAPAIANAIYDAIGVRIKELPITPDKILRALAEKKGL
jgi:CO/xanthine dehydrogenase Mo-binding subunit